MVKTGTFVFLCICCLPLLYAVPVDISVGGVELFSSLAASDATVKQRATGRVGLYGHAMAVQNAYDGKYLSTIADIFGHAGCQGELPYEPPSTSPGFFTGWWNLMFTKNGLTCTNVAVNFPGITPGNGWNLSAWEIYVGAAKTVGIRVVGPVYSPNAGNEPLNVPFATDPYYAFVRQLISAGGGLVIDAPPSYFFGRGPAYMDFVEQEIKWAKSNGHQVTYIISPDSSGTLFLNYTQRLVRELTSANALPNLWAVENYQVPAPPGYLNWVGTEDTPHTVTSIALWLATSTPILGTYMGCYIDNITNRDLAGAGFSATNMTVQICQNYCGTRNFPYSGVQFGQECRCGNQFGKYGATTGTDCNTPCAGNNEIMCGGSLSNSVYSIDAL